MPKMPKRAAKEPAKQFMSRGVDLMGGPQIRTTPSQTRPIFIPQRRLNVGMDRFP